MGLTCPGGSIPSAVVLTPPWQHLLSSWSAELDVEALQLLGHLPCHPEGPTCPGEGTYAVGATGRNVVLGTQLSREPLWGAGCLLGAPTELWKEGDIREGTQGSSTTTHPTPRGQTARILHGNQAPETGFLGSCQACSEEPKNWRGWG